ncbi:hypothetical protein B0H14DRAFT_3447267 [Mycena olivaceomarginata]|nr:hypothetical protein B0H14DRAFT_3447267 [Mycena olivaceomarginata]
MNTTLCYGPFTPHFSLPTPDLGAISTNLFVYNLLFLDDTFPSLTPYIDVRDVAPHPPLVPVRQPLQKRVGLIADQRPALKERLITATPQMTEVPDVLSINFKRVEEVLGMKTVDFHSVEETILDTVDALIEVEAQWRSAGHPIVTPTPGF